MRITAKRLLSGLLTFVLLVLVIVAIFFRQEAYDWWRLRAYEPATNIVALADATSMTEDARQTFYVTHPAVTDAQTFNDKCHIEEFSIILGCYISRGNIYIYDVEDKRLDGIHEVTAAHEMLHAAYERLSASEKEQVNNLLVETYKAINNQRLNNTIAQYQNADPGSVPNELHSILGTEVKKLPVALEEYYKRYFNDRSAVVALSEKYEREFSSRQTKVAQIDRQLQALKAEIELNQARLDELKKELSSQKEELDRLRANSQYSEYNQKVDDYNELVNEYNELVESTKGLISKYNKFVKERNSLVTEVQALVESIDSTPEQIQ